MWLPLSSGRRGAPEFVLRCPTPLSRRPDDRCNRPQSQRPAIRSPSDCCDNKVEQRKARIEQHPDFLPLLIFCHLLFLSVLGCPFSLCADAGCARGAALRDRAELRRPTTRASASAERRNRCAAQDRRPRSVLGWSPPRCGASQHITQRARFFGNSVDLGTAGAYAAIPVGVQRGGSRITAPSDRENECEKCANGAPATTGPRRLLRPDR